LLISLSLSLSPPRLLSLALPTSLLSFCPAFCHNMYEFNRGACAEPIQVATVASNATDVNATMKKAFMEVHNVIDIADGGSPILMGTIGVGVSS